jgi:hypothetical protein
MPEGLKYQSSINITPVGAPDVQSGYEKAAAGMQEFTSAVEKGFRDSEKQRLNAHAEDQILQVRKGIYAATDHVLKPQNFGSGALEQYDKSTEAVINGTLQNIDPRIRAKVKNNAEYYAFKQRTTVASAVRKLDEKKLRFHYEQSMDAFSLDGANSAYKAGMNDDDDSQIARDNAAKFKARAYSATQAALNHGIITGQYAAQKDKDFGETLQSETYMGGMRDALVSGKPQDYIDKYNQAKHADMSPSQRTTIALNLEKQRSQYEQANHITLSGVQSDFQDQLIRNQHGDSSGNAAVVAKAQQWFPNDAEAIEKELGVAKVYGGVSDASKYMNPLDSAKLAAQYGPSDKSPDLALRTKYYEAALKMIDQNQKDFAKDPAGYVAANQNVAAADRNFKMYGSGDPAAAKLSVQKQMGASDDPIKGQAPLALVPQAVGSALVGQAHGQDPADQLATMNAVMQEYDPSGKHQNIVLSDLKRYGLESATNGSYAMSTNPLSKQYLPALFAAQRQGKQKMMDSIKDVGVQSTGIWADVFGSSTRAIQESDIDDGIRKNLHPYNDSLGAHSGDITGAISDTSDTAKLLAMEFIQKGMDPKKAYKKAADATVNNFYDYGTMNGRTYRMPKGVSNYDTRKTGNYMMAQALISDVTVPEGFKAQYRDLPADRLKDLYKIDVMNSGYVRTTKDNRGIEIVDSSGIPVRGPNLDKYTASFEDISNPLSKLNKGMPARPKTETTMLKMGSPYQRNYFTKIFTTAEVKAFGEKELTGESRFRIDDTGEVVPRKREGESG